MKDLFVSLRMFFFMTVLVGVIYPVLVTLGGQALFPAKASGGFLSRGNALVGANLIGQKFESDRYFWPRPSAVDYNPLPSGGSNLGPTSADLKKVVDDRRTKIQLSGPKDQPIPQDLLYASASGLDPHISPEAAAYQIDRVGRARNLSATEIAKIIEDGTDRRQYGLFGEPTVNVLALNMALDQTQGLTAAPTPAPSPVPTPAPSPNPAAQ